MECCCNITAKPILCRPKKKFEYIKGVHRQQQQKNEENTYMWIKCYMREEHTHERDKLKLRCQDEDHIAVACVIKFEDIYAREYIKQLLIQVFPYCLRIPFWFFEYDPSYFFFVHEQFLIVTGSCVGFRMRQQKKKTQM